MIRVALALLLLSSPALAELRIVSPRDGARVSHDGPINIIARPPREGGVHGWESGALDGAFEAPVAAEKAILYLRK